MYKWSRTVNKSCGSLVIQFNNISRTIGYAIPSNLQSPIFLYVFSIFHSFLCGSLNLKMYRGWTNFHFLQQCPFSAKSVQQVSVTLACTVQSHRMNVISVYFNLRLDMNKCISSLFGSVHAWCGLQGNYISQHLFKHTFQIILYY